MSVFPIRPDCPLPDVPPIGRNLIQTCEIPGAPDPIFQGLEFPPIPVPAPIGCAEIITNVELIRDDNLPAKFEIDIEYKDDDFCFPEWKFDINIPCECTVIRNGKIKVKGGELTVGFAPVEPDPEDPCNCDMKFNFDLKIDDPCQAIDYGEVGGKIIFDNTYSISGQFTRDPNNDCLVGLDFELHLKALDIDPCEAITSGPVTGEVKYGNTPRVAGIIRLGQTTPSIVFQSAGALNHVEAVSADILTYTGELPEIYTIEVIQGGATTSAKFKVTSESGTDDQASISPSSMGSPTAIGTHDLFVTFDTSGTGGDVPLNEFIVGQTWEASLSSGAGCRLTADLDITIPEPDSCVDAYILNTSAEKCPKGGTFEINGVTELDGIEYLTGTKPSASNLQNTAVAVEEIEPGVTGPISFSSGSNCDEVPKAIVAGPVVTGQNMGTTPNSWELTPNQEGFIAMGDGSESVPFKPSSSTEKESFIVNTHTTNCPRGGVIAITDVAFMGAIEYLIGTQPTENSMLNTVIAAEDIPGNGGIGRVRFDSRKRIDNEIPKAFVDGEVEGPGSEMGTVPNSWALDSGQTGYISLEGGSGYVAFKYGGGGGGAGKVYKATTASTGATASVKRVGTDGVVIGETFVLPVYPGINNVEEGTYLIEGTDAEDGIGLIPLHKEDEPPSTPTKNIPMGNGASGDGTTWSISENSKPVIAGLSRLYWSGADGADIQLFTRSLSFDSYGNLTAISAEFVAGTVATGPCS
jgi:hypothetical protein